MRRVATILALMAATAMTVPAAHAAGERGNTGATPRDAARHFLVPGRNFRVLSTRVAGDFAIVRFSGALMEGDPNWASGIVIERFPFGWQVVDILRNACLGARGATRAQIAALGAANLPAYRDSDGQPCSNTLDRGPRADVVAVRSMDRSGTAIPYVRVVADYALLDWAYPGGGQRAVIRRAGRWRFAGGGGGAMNAQTLYGYGVPMRYACEIIPPASYDSPELHAKCKAALGRSTHLLKIHRLPER
jgi:hypothetical protein